MLTEYGIITDSAVRDISSHYDGVYIGNYVVMPNHIHLLLRFEKHGTHSVQTVIGSLKRFISRRAGFPVWQKSFYDHIIRDQSDYETKYNYITGNPSRWSEDEYF